MKSEPFPRPFPFWCKCINKMKIEINSFPAVLGKVTPMLFYYCTQPFIRNINLPFHNQFSNICCSSLPRVGKDDNQLCSFWTKVGLYRVWGLQVFFMTEIQPNLPLTRNHKLDRAPYHNSGLIVVMMKEIMIW